MPNRKLKDIQKNVNIPNSTFIYNVEFTIPFNIPYATNIYTLQLLKTSLNIFLVDYLKN